MMADSRCSRAAFGQRHVTSWRASTLRTASTSSLSGTANCASACFLQVVVAVLAQARDLGAEDQVLDLHLALGLLVAALDDDAGRAALVGIFQLLAEIFRIAEIELGADAGVAQRRDHALVVGDAVAVEHRDHDRTGRGLGVELADQRERRLQARDADGEAGRRHRLAAEARHEAVVAPAAADRAEAHRAGLFRPWSRAGEFDFVDRAGVVLEAADDGGIDRDRGRRRSPTQLSVIRVADRDL